MNEQEATPMLDRPITHRDALIVVVTWIVLDGISAAIGPGATFLVASSVLLPLLTFFWWKGRQRRREAGDAR